MVGEPTEAPSPCTEKIASGDGIDERSSDVGDGSTPASLATDDDTNYPDGGLVAWMQVLSSHLMNCLAWGYASAFGVYQLYYTETMKLPRSQISWIGSIQIAITFAICTVSGRLSDAGYNRATVIGGSTLAVFGTAMTSLATEYWQILLAQGICTGIGLGLLFMPGVAVVSSYFYKRRSFALAMAATGTGSGSVIFPATVQYLIPRIGFPWAVRCAALVALVICALSLALLRPRLKPRRSGPLVEWGAFKEPPYVLFTLGTFFLFWALYFGFFYINTYAREEIGFTSTRSVELLLITNAMSIPARPVVGYLADNVLGPLNTVICATAILGCMFFAWIGVTTKTGIYVFCVFFGLSNGAAQGVFGGALTSLTSDPRKMGTRFGMVATLLGLAALAGPPTAGAIIDRSGGEYLGAQLWGAIVILAGAATIGASRVSITGWKLKAKV